MLAYFTRAAPPSPPGHRLQAGDAHLPTRETVAKLEKKLEKKQAKLEAKTAEFKNIVRRVFYVDFFCRESNTSVVRPRCTSSTAVRR